MDFFFLKVDKEEWMCWRFGQVSWREAIMRRADLILSLQKRRNNERGDDSAPKLKVFKLLRAFLGLQDEKQKNNGRNCGNGGKMTKAHAGRTRAAYSPND